MSKARRAVQAGPMVMEATRSVGMNSPSVKRKEAGMQTSVKSRAPQSNWGRFSQRVCPT